MGTLSKRISTTAIHIFFIIVSIVGVSLCINIKQLQHSQETTGFHTALT